MLLDGLSLCIMNVAFRVLNTLQLFSLDCLQNGFKGLNSFYAPLGAEYACQNLQQSEEDEAT